MKKKNEINFDYKIQFKSEYQRAFFVRNVGRRKRKASKVETKCDKIQSETTFRMHLALDKNIYLPCSLVCFVSHTFTVAFFRSPLYPARPEFPASRARHRDSKVTTRDNSPLSSSTNVKTEKPSHAPLHVLNWLCLECFVSENSQTNLFFACLKFQLKFFIRKIIETISLVECRKWWCKFHKLENS